MRRRYNEPEGQLIRKQRSIWFINDRNSETTDYMRQQLLHYVRMFIEDISMRIVPSSIGRDDHEPQLILEPPNEATEQLLCGGFAGTGDSLHHSLSYPFSEFVRLLISELCVHTDVTYEIVLLYEPEKECPVGFELIYLDPIHLRRRWGRVWQIVPTDIAREHGVSTKIRLPPENLVTFRLPRDIRRTLEQSIDSLTVLSELHWSTLSMAAMDGKLPYDFKKHHRSMLLALAEATRATGWNARGTLQEHTLSIFWLRREIEYHRFIGRIRRVLFDEINALLKRLGPKLNISAQLRFDGFPSVADLDDLLCSIDTGSQPLTEILKRLK